MSRAAAVIDFALFRLAWFACVSVLAAGWTVFTPLLVEAARRLQEARASRGATSP